MARNISSIKKCNDQILKLVFEISVQDAGKGNEWEYFKQATILSHVSRRWRCVALSTPKLWEYVRCGLLWEEDWTEEVERIRGKEIGEFWARTLSRLRGHAPKISLEQFGYEDSYSLAYVRLRSFRHIRTLALDLQGPLAISRLVAPSFEVPCGHVEELELNGEEMEEALYPSLLLQRFPSVHQVTFKDIPRIIFTQPFITITHIIFHESSIYDIITALSCFSRLVDLEIYMPPIFDSHPNEKAIVLPYLRRLHLTEVHPPRWLNRITCPVLDAFLPGESITMDEAMAFIPLHTSIKTFGLLTEDELDWLPDTEALVEHLIVRYSGTFLTQVDEENVPSFPSLKTVKIHNLAMDDPSRLRIAEFEELARTRCLPQSHTESELLEGTEPLEEMAILIEHWADGGDLRAYVEANAEWTKSELYKAAKKEFTRDFVWDDWGCVRLAWG